MPINERRKNNVAAFKTTKPTKKCKILVSNSLKQQTANKIKEKALQNSLSITHFLM
jgi:hypothetical protein